MRRNVMVLGVFLGLLWSAAALAQGAPVPTPPPQQPPPSPGMIGANLDSVIQSSDFFQFFHLRQVQTAPGAGGRTMVDFRPDSPQFGPLVRVSASVDSTRIIHGMSIVIMRSFIDDATNSPFARDIAKSFITDVPPPADSKQLEGFVNEIYPGANTGASPSPEYNVFLGKSPGPVAKKLTKTNFQIGQVTEQGKPALRISVE